MRKEAFKNDGVSTPCSRDRLAMHQTCLQWTSQDTPTGKNMSGKEPATGLMHKHLYQLVPNKPFY
ncbi:hypothetical protein ACTJJ0_11060 [Chitinophaga sp. 22321]|uniref:hypothetical protein n=1 Tax=Chitinophaga sp. 22321 TaxID=3453909 RepID=UPI003F84B7E6